MFASPKHFLPFLHSERHKAVRLLLDGARSLSLATAHIRYLPYLVSLIVPTMPAWGKAATAALAARSLWAEPEGWGMCKPASRIELCADRFESFALGHFQSRPAPSLPGEQSHAEWLPVGQEDCSRMSLPSNNRLAGESLTVAAEHQSLPKSAQHRCHPALHLDCHEGDLLS